MTCQIRSDFFLLSSLPCPEDLLCIKQFPEVNQSFSNTGELVLIPLFCGFVPAKLGEVIQMAHLVPVHCHMQRFFSTWYPNRTPEVGAGVKGVWSAWQGGPFGLRTCHTLTLLEKYVWDCFPFPCCFLVYSRHFQSYGQWDEKYKYLSFYLDFYFLKALEVLKAAVTLGRLKLAGAEKLQQQFQGTILQRF